MTNNEVSEEEARALAVQGLRPGQEKWERHGICQAITLPRCKYVINGRRDDGSPLLGDYLTGRKVQKEIARIVRLLGFTTPTLLADAKARKQLAAVAGLTQNKVDDGPWYLQEDELVSVLWDPSRLDDSCEALAENGEAVETVLVALPDNREFKAVKACILEALPPLYKEENETRPMADGFEESLQYFRLDFLDPTNVELGREFPRLLPILWMIAGAKRPLPEATGNEPYIFPDECPFAVLLDETRFCEFANELGKREGLTHIFLITDSQDAFFAMKEDVKSLLDMDERNVVQLYRNYLENF